MIEKQNINGRDVWLKVEAYHVERDNPNVIPTEYFTAMYYLNDPQYDVEKGEVINDDEGNSKLFESPVAAVTYAWMKLKQIL